MYVPELRTRREEKKTVFNSMETKRDDHPGSTRPHNEAEKAEDGIEPNHSSTIVTGSRREKSTKAEESLDLMCGLFCVASNEVNGHFLWERDGCKSL